jgi:hypothetical protein
MVEMLTVSVNKKLLSIVCKLREFGPRQMKRRKPKAITLHV